MYLQATINNERSLLVVWFKAKKLSLNLAKTTMIFNNA